MRSIRILLLLGLVAMMTITATAAVSATGGRPLAAGLTGAAEVPTTGDPDGSGSARITVNHGLGKVCYRIAVSGIVLPAAAAHIHVGDAGVAGAVVVPLAAPDANGISSGCADVTRVLAKALIQNPTHYYVNVHNSVYPGGALRGQLTR
ncbi:MAG: CHRD domain-containing protein [Candidatus Limnocylindrales bacterium]